MEKADQIKTLEEVVSFLKKKVDRVENVPGHTPQSGINGCSMACGPRNKPVCLYQQARLLLDELKK